MSEVPSGLSMPNIEEKATSSNSDPDDNPTRRERVEVLLAIVANQCRLFPGYWAFPGGGVSRVDTAASESLGISVQHCAILREVVEELGLAPQEGRLVSVEDDFRGNGCR